MNGEIEYNKRGTKPELENPCIECPFRVDTIDAWNGVLRSVRGRRKQCSDALKVLKDDQIQTCHMTDLTHVCRGAQIFVGDAPDTKNIVRSGIRNFHFVKIEEFFE